MNDPIKLADLQREIIQLKKELKAAKAHSDELEYAVDKLRAEKQEWKSVAHSLLLKLELDKVEAVKFDEARADAIGQNGNEGLHYRA